MELWHHQPEHVSDGSGNIVITFTKARNIFTQYPQLRRYTRYPQPVCIVGVEYELLSAEGSEGGHSTFAEMLTVRSTPVRNAFRESRARGIIYNSRFQHYIPCSP